MRDRARELRCAPAGNVIGASPGLDTIAVDERAGRTVGRDEREPDDGVGPLLDGLRSGEAVEVCRGEAGVGRRPRLDGATG